jgi:hypothetical protein
MRRLSLSKNLFLPFILGMTFISTYVPTIFAALAAGRNTSLVDLLKKPDVVGGLMGLLFSTLLVIGDANHLSTTDSLDTLNKKIEAQSHGNRLDEAYIKAMEGPFSPLFGNLAKMRLRKIHADLENMRADPPFYWVRQNDPVKEYVDIFVELMLHIIRPESDFRVVTTELIWSRDSFGGPDRRYLLANYRASKDRKIKIKRIFIVQGSEKLMANLDQAKMLLETLRDHERTLGEPKLGADLAVYEVESDADYHSFFRNPSNNFALWDVSEGNTICTVVEYTPGFSPKLYGISGFRFDSDKSLIEEKSIFFDNLRGRAMDLRKYIELLGEVIDKEAGRAQPKREETTVV